MHRRLISVLEAIRSMTRQELNGIFSRGVIAALGVHHEIRHLPASHKAVPFYQHLLPLREQLVSLLGNSYRQYFKLALAYPGEFGRNPEEWAWAHLQPDLYATLEWLREWYILACDGENQLVQPVGSVAFVPGETVSLPIPTTVPPSPPWKSWRAPAWLFGVSLPLFGIGLVKTKNIPPHDSEQMLGPSHSRLILKGGRRLFLMELRTVIERVRNEEVVAAAGRPELTLTREKRRPIKRKGWEQKQKLYTAIQKTLTDNASLQGREFCAELDRRHAPPLYDWTKCGEWREGLTWKEAWDNLRLRNKVRRVRQEAMKAL